MTKEEIRKASREYAMAKSNEKNTWFVDYEDIEEAFLEGAKWADEHPNLESIWHDTNIVPSDNKGITYLTKNNKLGVFNSIKSNNWDWYVSGKYSIIKWAYSSDLLPKGGEK